MFAGGCVDRRMHSLGRPLWLVVSPWPSPFAGMYMALAWRASFDKIPKRVSSPRGAAARIPHEWISKDLEERC